MPLFWKPYQSELTEFIGTLKKDRPSLEQEQQNGRALLWDKEQNREERSAFAQAKVAQKPYVYQTEAGLEAAE